VSVYVDRERNGFGRMVMCHMWADTLAELHAMADAIGMKREWFQPLSFPHYDVSLSRRAVAVELGAVQVDRREGSLIRKRIYERGFSEADLAEILSRFRRFAVEPVSRLAPSGINRGWEPTPDELAALAHGAKVMLRVVGTGHPPVMLYVSDIPDAIATGAQSAETNEDLAQSEGRQSGGDSRIAQHSGPPGSPKE
jgi:hypothetical protein